MSCRKPNKLILFHSLSEAGTKHHPGARAWQRACSLHSQPQQICWGWQWTVVKRADDMWCDKWVWKSSSPQQRKGSLPPSACQICLSVLASPECDLTCINQVITRGKSLQHVCIFPFCVGFSRLLELSHWCLIQSPPARRQVELRDFRCSR